MKQVYKKLKLELKIINIQIKIQDNKNLVSKIIIGSLNVRTLKDDVKLELAWSSNKYF